MISENATAPSALVGGKIGSAEEGIPCVGGGVYTAYICLAVSFVALLGCCVCLGDPWERKATEQRQETGVGPDVRDDSDERCGQ